MPRRISYQPDGLTVAKARTALRLTQEELAAACDVHRVTIANIENGRARVSLEMLERLAGALHLTRARILGEPEPVDPVEQAREEITAAIGEFGQSLTRLANLVDALNGSLHDTVARTQTGASTKAAA